MLMFVFGAGASFDSDPYRRPGDPELFPSDIEHRPPLATGLFDPDSYVGKDVVAAFPRAADLIMRLRQATAQNLDVEETLEQINASEAIYPDLAVELLALRAYLARLMYEIPAKWIEECQGLTNYVRVLAEAKRWNQAVHAETPEPVACVTFNYDSMLEQAVESVFGHRVTDMDRYTTHNEIQVFKPHGSVTWRSQAGWDVEPGRHVQGPGALSIAINQAASLKWVENKEEECWAYLTDDRYQDPHDTTKVWLPALSIPVRSKSDFSMPNWHMDAMVESLKRVTVLVAVGWRARERHFLQLLQDHMPTAPARLVAVAESKESADATIDALWETGRFDKYAISGAGFSGFTEVPTESAQAQPDHAEHPRLTLNHVLSAGPNLGVWCNRKPGSGLTPLSAPRPFLSHGYADL